jgi:hypothetical protein
LKEAIEKSVKEQNLQEKRIIIPKDEWYNLNTGEEEIGYCSAAMAEKENPHKFPVETNIGMANLEIKIVVPFEKIDDEDLFLLLCEIKKLVKKISS